jgi:tripartite ATP-independent transporter DctP family solute receptor
MKKRLLTRAFSIVLVLGLMNLSTPMLALGKQVIKISHPTMPGSPRDLGAHKIEEVVEKMTNNQVDVQVYPTQQLGQLRTVIEGLQTGNIEINIAPSTALGGFAPLTTILDLPFFLPDDLNKLLKLYYGPAGKKVMAVTDRASIRTFDIWHTGYMDFTSNKPIRTPEDMKGMKFRMIPNPIKIQQFKDLGATGVNIDFSEVYTALQTGAIDGQENPVVVNYDQKYYEVQKYTDVTHHSVIALFVMVSKVWWDRQPQNIKDALLKGIAEGRKVNFEAAQKKLVKDSAAMKKYGMKFIELTPQDREKFIQKCLPVQKFYTTKYGKEAGELLNLFKSEMK